MQWDNRIGYAGIAAVAAIAGLWLAGAGRPIEGNHSTVTLSKVGDDCHVALDISLGTVAEGRATVLVEAGNGNCTMLRSMQAEEFEGQAGITRTVETMRGTQDE